MTLQPGESKTIPFAVVLDFPVQEYIDGKTFDRKYIKNFKNAKTRALDMVKIALKLQAMVESHINNSGTYL